MSSTQERWQGVTDERHERTATEVKRAFQLTGKQLKDARRHRAGLNEFHIGRLLVRERRGEPGTYDVMVKTTGMSAEQAAQIHATVEEVLANKRTQARTSPKRIVHGVAVPYRTHCGLNSRDVLVTDDIHSMTCKRCQAVLGLRG